MKKSSNKGFTLVELIIVIAILAIIMLIAIPNFSGIQQRMQVRADKSTAAQIGKAVRIWYTEYGSDPAFKNNVEAKYAADATAEEKTITEAGNEVGILPKMPSNATAGSLATTYVALPANSTTVQLHAIPYLISYVDTTLLPTSLRKSDKTIDPDQKYWVGITGVGTGEKIAVSIGNNGSALQVDSKALTQDNVTYDGNASGIAYLEP